MPERGVGGKVERCCDRGRRDFGWLLSCWCEIRGMVAEGTGDDYNAAWVALARTRSRSSEMNFVVIMCDTMRADHLGCYGNEWIRTPNLDAFAREAIVFERAYCGSWPTVPNRTDLFTGRFGEPLHAWLPLSWEAVTLPEMMREHGYVCHLILDTPHIINSGFGFDRPFHSWWMIRGNEKDRFNSDYGALELGHAKEKIVASQVAAHAQYMRNIVGRTSEKDYFAPRVMSAATDWLERNYEHEKFFLWVDCFDPHEPWDPPQHYVDLYDPDFKGQVPSNFFNVPKITPRELKQIRARYAGKVTMVDKWVGRVLRKLEALGIADETAVVVMSDHGTGLGDHGKIKKSAPIYEEVGRIVWLMRLPGGVGAGKRTGALVQPADLMPTFLDLAGIEIPEFVQGSSLLPLVGGEKRRVREFAVTGHAAVRNTTDLTVTSRRWALLHPAVREKWELYDLRNDPRQKRNVISTRGDVAEGLHRKLLAWLAEHEAPEWLLEAYERCEEQASPRTRESVAAERRRSLRMSGVFRWGVSFSDD